MIVMIQKSTFNNLGISDKVVLMCNLCQLRLNEGNNDVEVYMDGMSLWIYYDYQKKCFVIIRKDLPLYQSRTFFEHYPDEFTSISFDMVL